jgi:hypothetical protein
MSDNNGAITVHLSLLSVTIWIMNGEGLKKYIPKLLNSALHVQQTLLVDKIVHDVLVTEINKITEYAGYVFL